MGVSEGHRQKKSLVLKIKADNNFICTSNFRLIKWVFHKTWIPLGTVNP